MNNDTIEYLKNRKINKPDLTDKFRQAYEAIEHNFNEITDDTLIDALCYEKKALDCKLDYIIREQKEDTQIEIKKNKSLWQNVLTILQTMLYLKE